RGGPEEMAAVGARGIARPDRGLDAASMVADRAAVGPTPWGSGRDGRDDAVARPAHAAGRACHPGPGRDGLDHGVPPPSTGRAAPPRSPSDRDQVLRPRVLDERQQERPVLAARLADRGDVHGRVVLHGAFMLTDAAADAFDWVNIW